eukprot:jgi/Chrzof1/6518/UNPLg00867.t1
MVGLARDASLPNLGHGQSSGRGPTITINRAELTAIHYTIDHLGRHESITAATDSLCSLQMIQKILHRPKLLLHAKHGQLLRSIATMITDRAALGIHTNLIKVKAHTGIVGNEIADKAANEAAESQTGHMVTVGADPYASMHWLAQQQRDERGNTRLRYMDNLTGHLKRTAKASHCLGGAQAGTYYGLWEATAPTMNWKASTHCYHSTSVDHSTKRLVLKARFGVL